MGFCQFVTHCVTWVNFGSVCLRSAHRNKLKLLKVNSKVYIYIYVCVYIFESSSNLIGAFPLHCSFLPLVLVAGEFLSFPLKKEGGGDALTPPENSKM